jgi:hypothetical protein
MGMGYAAAYVDAVEEEVVRDTCPTEYQVLVDALRTFGLDMEHAARCFMWEPCDTGVLTDDLPVTEDRDHTEYAEACVRQVTSAWEALRKAFAAATAVGESRLELSIGYHDPDAGRCYDDVEGLYWHVDGAYEMSAAGRKHEKDIHRSFFVVCG